MTVLRVELTLNLRDMNMALFALIMPLAVMAILGCMGGIPLAHSYGALCAISICAGGAMGLPLLISEYRERGVWMRLWATPVRPVQLLAVQGLIYLLYAVASAASLWAFGAMGFGMRLDWNPGGFAAAWLLTLASMFGIGMLVGGVARDSKRASMIASALYFPQLILSGTTIPMEHMPEFMRRAANLMPLTLGVRLMRAASLGESLRALWPQAAVLLAVFLGCVAAAVRLFRWE